MEIKVNPAHLDIFKTLWVITVKGKRISTWINYGTSLYWYDLLSRVFNRGVVLWQVTQNDVTMWAACNN